MDKRKTNENRRKVGRVTVPYGVLTPREEDVLVELSKGLSNKGIGRVLWLSEATVEGYLNRVYKKLGVSSRGEAIVYALTHGIGQKHEPEEQDEQDEQNKENEKNEPDQHDERDGHNDQNGQNNQG